MKHAKLKVLATAYDADAEMCSFAIGLGKKWIGSVKRTGRFFIATIGPAKGKGLLPETAARAAWHAFCDFEPRSYGFAPPAADGLENAIKRVSVKTITRGQRFTVLIGGKRKGEVRKQPDGSHLAVIDGTARKGAGPVEAARLAWAAKSGLV